MIPIINIDYGVFKKTPQERLALKEAKLNCTNKSPKSANMVEVDSTFTTKQKIGEKYITHSWKNGKLIKSKK